jgi:hypothetical protein
MLGPMWRSLLWRRDEEMPLCPCGMRIAAKKAPAELDASRGGLIVTRQRIKLNEDRDP